MNLIFSIWLIMCISMITMKISSLLAKKMKLKMEKMSPFECGFNSINKSRLPFSFRFFLITIMFLIFDVEIALFLPMIFTMKLSFLKSWLITSILFLTILMIGIFHEWSQGILNWY